MRGLKLSFSSSGSFATLVAPLAGAWIETKGLSIRSTSKRSHPSRVRGLKLQCAPCTDNDPHVAPLAGAWIETFILLFYCQFSFVAPLAGAWIETCTNANIFSQKKVAPLAGAWIETRKSPAAITSRIKSHPSRVRGLKLMMMVLFGACKDVAPLAGAWIETGSPSRPKGAAKGRTPRGCVD